MTMTLLPTIHHNFIYEIHAQSALLNSLMIFLKTLWTTPDTSGACDKKCMIFQSIAWILSSGWAICLNSIYTDVDLLF